MIIISIFALFLCSPQRNDIEGEEKKTETNN